MIRAVLTCLTVGAVLLTASGCSYLCRFDLRGQIRDAQTGQPVPDVRVSLTKADGSSLGASTITSNADGAFESNFTQTPTADDYHEGWQITFSADGYEPQTIALGPVKNPQGGNDRTHILVHAALRKSK